MKHILALDIASSWDSPFGKSLGINNLIGTLLSGAIVIASVILIFLLVGGGFQVISGAGNNDPKASAAGKQSITTALAGFLIVLATYWIIRIIELIVGVDFFTLPGFSS